MVRTAICAFTVQHVGESVHDILRRTAAAGYDGFQFSKRRLWGSATPRAIRETLNETGLDVTPAHLTYESLSDGAVLDQHEALGDEHDPEDPIASIEHGATVLESLR